MAGHKRTTLEEGVAAEQLEIVQPLKLAEDESYM
jgi:hypothetical protein